MRLRAHFEGYDVYGMVVRVKLHGFKWISEGFINVRLASNVEFTFAGKQHQVEY